MTNLRPIASALLLAALSTASIAMAEPKGLQGNTFGHSAASQAEASPASVRMAQCDCQMMKGDAAMQAQCMGMTAGRPSDGSKSHSAG
jgi:hypothetical protein